MQRCDEVLQFWFAGLADSDPIPEERLKLWFGGGEATDRLVRETFEADVRRAIAGELTDWETSPRGCLAEIILLDQFTRNIYRDLPESFEHDPLALRLCLRGIEQEYDLQLQPIERVFFYLPMEHSEDRALQQRSVQAFTKLVEAAPAAQKERFEEFLDYAVRHQRVIERFGRFAHRNAVLGRTSTPEELEFLAGPDAPF